MIGIIVTGHGNFASGITSALELIMGKEENFLAIDFLDTDTKESIKNKYNESIDVFKDCDNIIVLTDLFGGTPFNVLMEMSIENSKLHLYYGVNLAMLMELVSKRKFNENIEDIVDGLVDNAKLQIGKFSKEQLSKFEENEDEL